MLKPARRAPQRHGGKGMGRKLKLAVPMGGDAGVAGAVVFSSTTARGRRGRVGRPDGGFLAGV